MEAQPISINNFDDIAGNYPFYSRFTVFVRSAGGVYNDDISFGGATVATAINWAGSVVGYSTDGEGSYSGFVLHPDGYSSELTVPLPASGRTRMRGRNISRRHQCRGHDRGLVLQSLQTREHGFCEIARWGVYGL